MSDLSDRLNFEREYLKKGIAELRYIAVHEAFDNNVFKREYLRLLDARTEYLATIEDCIGKLT